MDNSIVLHVNWTIIWTQMPKVDEITAEDLPLLYMDWINETDQGTSKCLL